jgi:hypothetical protein
MLADVVTAKLLLNCSACMLLTCLHAQAQLLLLLLLLLTAARHSCCPRHKE